MQGVAFLLRLIHVSWRLSVWTIVSPSLAHAFQLVLSWLEVKVSIVLAQFHDFEYTGLQPVLGSIGPVSNHVLYLAGGQESLGLQSSKPRFEAIRSTQALD